MPVLVLGWDCGDTVHPPSSVHELQVGVGGWRTTGSEA